MRVFVNVKQAGSRKNYIAKEEIIIDLKPSTLRELIEAIVSKNVNDFNDKINDKNLLNYLTKDEIENKSANGKVSFGEIHNQKEQSLKKALETAYLAYEDGIYEVFIGDREAGTLDEVLEIKDGDVLTFIKFTMLVGRMW